MEDDSVVTRGVFQVGKLTRMTALAGSVNVAPRQAQPPHQRKAPAVCASRFISLTSSPRSDQRQNSRHEMIGSWRLPRTGAKTMHSIHSVLLLLCHAADEPPFIFLGIQLLEAASFSGPC